VFKNALWTALQIISGQNALDCRISNIQSQNFSGVIPPGLCRSIPGAWTQTPISDWLVSIPIITVWRNNQLVSQTINQPITTNQQPINSFIHSLSYYSGMS